MKKQAASKKTHTSPPTKMRVEEMGKHIERLEREIHKIRNHGVVEYHKPNGPARVESGAAQVLDMVSSGTAYTEYEYNVNVSDTTLFPRLAPVAALYQKWRIRKLKFKYVPSTSSFGSAGKEGNVVIFWSPDVNHATSAAFASIEQYKKRSKIVLPCESCELTLTGADQDLSGIPWLDVYDAYHVQPADYAKLFCGRVSVGWEGVANAAKLGRFMCEYEVELAGVQPNGLVYTTPKPSNLAVGHTAVNVAITNATWTSFSMALTNAAGTNGYAPSIATSSYSGIVIAGTNLRLREGNWILTASAEFNCSSSAITLAGVRLFDVTNAGTIFTVDDAANSLGIKTVTMVVPLEVKQYNEFVLQGYCAFSTGTTAVDYTWSVFRV
jgi:hypothetical protein